MGVATLWNPSELSEMGLVPCCHTSTWNLDGGRLNCVLDQRSGDMPYGVPFNTTQYAELMIMLAKAISTPEKEIKPGLLTHVIADAHIYENQMSGVELQLFYYDMMRAAPDIINIGNFSAPAKMIAEKYPNLKDIRLMEVLQRAIKVMDSVPHFEIYADASDFFSYDAESCKVEDYEHMGKIDFGDIAV